MHETTAEVLAFIEHYVAEHHLSPTFREIAQGTALKSTSTVGHHLEELRRLGRSSYGNQQPRTIRVLTEAGK